MPLHLMCNADKLFEPNVCVDMCWGAGKIDHDYQCPHRGKQPTIESERVKQPDCLPGCHPRAPIFMETSYVGCVIKTREMNGRDDSDFYATVWNEVEGRAEEIEYASTRGWSYPNGAVVDATPEVLAKYRLWRIECAVQMGRDRSRRESTIPAAGKVCRVVKGRKFKKGLEVTVKRCEEQVYGVGRWATRTTTALVTFQLGDITTQGWVPNIENLEVINPDQYLLSEEAIREQAIACVDGGYSLLSYLPANVLAQIR